MLKQGNSGKSAPEVQRAIKGNRFLQQQQQQPTASSPSIPPASCTGVEGVQGDDGTVCGEGVCVVGEGGSRLQTIIFHE